MNKKQEDRYSTIVADIIVFLLTLVVIFALLFLVIYFAKAILATL